MWSMFSQDFSDFAQAFKSESADLVGYLGHIASDVVGRGEAYAGDEILHGGGKTSASAAALPNELLQRLQGSRRTYALPIQPEEAAAFAAWKASSPLSSTHVHKRQRDTPAAALEKTPTRASPGFPDEPADETRQRLLDYNEVVLQQYTQAVGDAISPRSSMPASPATPSAAAPSAEAAATPGVPSMTSPVQQKKKGMGTLSEDEFFDRYFFRLTQLRTSEVERSARAREQRREVAAATAPTPSRTAAQNSPPSQRMTKGEDMEDEDDDFVAVPLFAKRMMSAASGLVTGIDNALNNVVSVETSRCMDGEQVGRSDGEDSAAADADENADSAAVSPATWEDVVAARSQVTELEGLTQELQAALRCARRRVDQLTSILVAHNIDIPAPEVEIPHNRRAPTAAASSEAHQDPVTPTAASEMEKKDNPGKAAAVPSSTPAAPVVSASTDAALTPAMADAGDDGRVPSSGAAAVISVGSEEEEEEAWVHVNPAGEL